MRIEQHELPVATRGQGFVNLTAQVQGLLSRSGLEVGHCVVFCQHTSASLVLQENADPAVLRDLSAWMSELVVETRRWEHNEEGPDDMPAHVRCALTRASETIPFSAGRLLLGTWQALYLWEHRAKPHQRHLLVSLCGSPR